MRQQLTVELNATIAAWVEEQAQELNTTEEHIVGLALISAYLKERGEQ